MKQFKPMLAANLQLVTKHESWPMYASPKLDGIRCVVRDGIPYSRSNKVIRNKHIQRLIKQHADQLEGLDGELVVGSPTAKDVYRKTNSAVMSTKGEPEFTFFIFDNINIPEEAYKDRFESLKSLDLPPFAEVLTCRLFEDAADVFEFEKFVTDFGYEGVILRHPDQPYKFGRSTLEEAGMLKLKRFKDAEAYVIGFGVLMNNGNEAFTDELGYTKRSKASKGLTPSNMLGYLLCRTPEGVDFKIGTGFSQKEREDLWADQDNLIGRLVKFKFFDLGIKDAPRHPVFLGFRDESDLGDFND